MDDFLLFADDRQVLRGWLEQARRKLEELRLLLHQRKSKIYPVEQGIPFLGFRVFPTHRKLLPYGVKRARRRLARLVAGYESGQIGMEAVGQSVTAWIAHAAHGSTYGLRRHLLQGAVFRAGGRNCASGRRLEQQP